MTVRGTSTSFPLLFFCNCFFGLLHALYASHLSRSKEKRTNRLVSHVMMMMMMIPLSDTRTPQTDQTFYCTHRNRERIHKIKGHTHAHGQTHGKDEPRRIAPLPKNNNWQWEMMNLEYTVCWQEETMGRANPNTRCKKEKEIRNKYKNKTLLTPVETKKNACATIIIAQETVPY